ncbi:membrane associated rhomboid family serine protease [Hydrogenispora ethanolica]|uniref:Membrane associated rhomboid family serine protease n=1 Tax=Hydrogenispora ethanolica TaxID=1082276 RepID=A0A4R1QN60_HYDET|nr:rhomboid family intramembrane serine protease [Hydrogenispora ethanolica]TCL54403.1 membrane associated rhomboid family serine protease [Hydrogenispora ethanolica]
MNWLNTIERRLGRYAIRNLMYYVIVLNAVFYGLMFFDRTGSVIRLLELDPALILRGQVWRLISFIFIPPMVSPLWIIFTLYFYYLVGVNLEHEWGSFRFNLYYLIGMLATIVVAFLFGGATGVYLNLSLFLAFAYLFPNYQIMLFFVLPVKIKYLAWLNWAVLAWTVLTGSWGSKAAAVASVVNYFVFFGADLIATGKLNRQVHQNRKRFFEQLGDTPVFHRCAACGITDKTHPKMDFSYCKLCDGEYEYCTRHIQDHQHVRKNSEEKP